LEPLEQQVQRSDDFRSFVLKRCYGMLQDERRDRGHALRCHDNPGVFNLKYRIERTRVVRNILNRKQWRNDTRYKMAIDVGLQIQKVTVAAGIFYRP
jgi:hypothetical protein